MKRICLVCTLLAALALAPAAMAAHIQTTGHTDIRYLYDAQSGTADIAYFLDQGSTVDGQAVSTANPVGGTPVVIGSGTSGTKISYQPTDLVTYIPGPSMPRPSAASWNPTGVAAGEPLWFIPQGQDPLKPWTGFSTESVSSSDFSNIKYQLTAFSGPGQMAVGTNNSFGVPTFNFRTSDGLSAADVISVSTNTHAHFNWFFTAMGTYTFELKGIGTRTAAAGGGTVSVADTFTFQVVPEPASLGLLTIAGVMFAGRRQRKSH